MVALEKRTKELEAFLQEADEPPPLLHPNMAEVYHRKIASLYAQLQSNEIRAKAAETF